MTVILGAVMVTYNRLAHLQQTLPRLLAEAVDHVLVVDNASTDATAQWLGTLRDPRLTVLRLDDNSGGAGGFEAGLAAMTRTHDPDWTVLLDDDACPCAGALAVFRGHAAGFDPDAIGAVAAAVIFPDGTLCEMNRPARNPFWHPGALLRTVFFGGRQAFHLRTDEIIAPAGADIPPPVDVDTASFVGFFVSRNAVARTGLPEGGLFIYGDDVLYSLRLRRAGFRLCLLPDVRFEHDCKSLGTGLATRPLWKVYYLCRNGVSVARQASGPVLFPVALLYYCVKWARKAAHYTAQERPVYRSLMWAGVRDGLRGRRGRHDAVHDRAASSLAPEDLSR
jgi:GT2 family glycosyltransferase